MRLRFLIVLALSLVLTGCALIPSIPPFSDVRQAEVAPTAPAAEVAPSSAPTPAAAGPRVIPVVMIMDASGSMRQADMSGDVTRMAAAREAAKRFIDGLPEGTPAGLVSYGDRTPEDAPKEQGCADVSVKVSLGEAAASFATALDSLNPTGWTPISAALRQAVDMVPEGPAHVVLVSDGEETCAPPEPCEVTRSAVAEHPALVVSTIGVRAHSEQLACIANAGNGVYVTADSADQLTRRLEAVRDPSKAALQLSPQGASGIAPGQRLSQIRERHPDFPDVQPVPGQAVEVVWRECRWQFDDQLILRAIAAEGASTIDDIRVGDPISTAAVLGQPVKTEAAAQGEWRYYLADRAAKLAWRLRVENDRIAAIVLCACLPDPPATLDNAVLDTSGLGPLTLGMSLAELRRRGWVEQEPTCRQWVSTSVLQARGVHVTVTDRLNDIHLISPHYATRSGARVGMTYAQLQQIYGSDLRLETKQGNGGPFQVAAVRAGDREVVFLRAWDESGFTASTRIETITARPYSDGIYGGC